MIRLHEPRSDATVSLWRIRGLLNAFIHKLFIAYVRCLVFQTCYMFPPVITHATYCQLSSNMLHVATCHHICHMLPPVITHATCCHCHHTRYMLPPVITHAICFHLASHMPHVAFCHHIITHITVCQ
jgi:hypothetical protein